MTRHHIHKRHEHPQSEILNPETDFTGDDNQIEVRQNAVAQVYSTVYVYYTEAASFTGATAALSTQSAAATANTAKPVTTSSAKSNSILVATSSSSSLAISLKSSTSVSTTLPGSSTVPSTLSIAVASSSSASVTRLGSSATSSTSTSPTASSSAVNSNEGMSTGGKVGIAVGVVLGLCALISLLIFCFRRKKKQAAAERLEDEKSFVGTEGALGATRTPSTRTVKTASNAPRLSLRPVTQFSPNLAAQNGNAMAMQTISEKDGPSTHKSAWERPSTSASQDVHNPFGNHAEISNAGSAGAPVIATGPGGPHSLTQYAAPAAAALAVGATAGANTIGLARSASKRENRPQQLDLTSATPENVPQSNNIPGSAGGAAIAAAGGPQNSTVHRVQLDFKPSMEDELELKAGQLIRKLMEYDDGWCLCIRLDRSEQGVVPRTCLSSLPVKPRPAQARNNNGPPPANYRGATPRPGSAQSNRSGRGRPHYPHGQNDPPRPSSAQSNRSYQTPNPHFASQQRDNRPSSANSNRTLFPGAPGYNAPYQPAQNSYAQAPRNYNPRMGGSTNNSQFTPSSSSASQPHSNSQIPDADRQFYQNQREEAAETAADMRANSPAPLRVGIHRSGVDSDSYPMMNEREGDAAQQQQQFVERKPLPGMAL